MKSSWNEANIVSENNYYSEKRNYGCVPFDRSRSGFCDPKFEFSLIQDQTNLRLQSERSTSALGSYLDQAN